MTAPGCQPPAEVAHHEAHWLRSPQGKLLPLILVGERWESANACVSGRTLARWGWTYHAPCIPPAEPYQPGAPVATPEQRNLPQGPMINEQGPAEEPLPCTPEQRAFLEAVLRERHGAAWDGVDLSDGSVLLSEHVDGIIACATVLESAFEAERMDLLRGAAVDLATACMAFTEQLAQGREGGE